MALQRYFIARGGNLLREGSGGFGDGNKKLVVKTEKLVEISTSTKKTTCRHEEFCGEVAFFARAS